MPASPDRAAAAAGAAAAPAAAAGGDADADADADALLAALRLNWRKVASTDNLLLLAEDAPPPPERAAARPPRRRARALLQGLALIAAGAALLAWALFSMALSKLLPPSSVPAVAAVQNDWYYCFLGPLMLPVTFVAVTSNWFSLKLFKHNS
ncbi:hypothetical protein Rsub_11782 [Raphidocelis subcapitata]|uniref:Uncharacterized protein n=1 Tax=Raphidocelis subcapitata TaxID=307507 RepID=A0A2V0PP77_9CHLO|nr:hypothetical protein Rsub_11782 [Raphidocelis subcapitata]|eukprot:GBF99257.1 hypothetical protein Rsub_11782 [Raphidocelis subcapitata]